MKYFVVADVHGFYSKLIQVLKDNGFDEKSDEHKLIICGDIMDRGEEPVEMQDYILHLLDLDKVILVRGNHEDLVLDMLDEPGTYSFISPHHYSNGTVETMLRLTNYYNIFIDADTDKNFIKACRLTPFVSQIIPQTINYFEAGKYIFVHGWIPCRTQLTLPNHFRKGRNYAYNPNWREAEIDDWKAARWFHGQELAHNYEIREPGKTIVCGHWHCSWSWAYIKGDRPEYPNHSSPNFAKSFEPFYDEGIIAIDACTAYSGIMNCLVLEI